MINMYEVSETNKMIEHENLDVRTITDVYKRQETGGGHGPKISYPFPSV